MKDIHIKMESLMSNSNKVNQGGHKCPQSCVSMKCVRKLSKEFLKTTVSPISHVRRSLVKDVCPTLSSQQL